MRVVIWNCNMAFHRKTQHVAELCPDILIVPECASLDTIKKKAPNFNYSSADWIGHNSNKGLGVFAFGDIELDRHDSFDIDFELFLPMLVKNSELSFNLLAVWAYNHRAKGRFKGRRDGIDAAMNHFHEFLTDSDCLVGGDFNNNVQWDKPGKPSNFANVVDHFQHGGLESAYHVTQKCEFGAEKDPTHFFRKGLLEYHIDYCFLPKRWELTYVAVGDRMAWLPVSDHSPLVVDFEV